ncbi:YagK/YfjJ domain-containing protein [Psychrobacter sanguinis]|uniref:YagK/YfjJ domain-containing protein n=1 Tax=Psychrobacter sanguinis TaxID=861445 RepID=UPI0028991CE7|nr:inovirus-type Gp2 protein [Psychrobacter sanguinis]
MAKPTKDDYLEFYGGLTQYGCYLKEVFKEEKSQGIGLGIGSSLELLENVVLIEKQLRLLDSDKSEKLNVTTYKALLDAKEANYLLKEYFPFSTFSPYVEIFLKVTGEMQQSSLLEVLKALKLALGQEENKKNMVRSRKNDREKQEQLLRYIKSLFIASPSLLVVDLDVSYVDEWDYNQPLKMLPESTDQQVQKEESVRSERIKKVQHERNELITQLKKKYKKDLVGYIWKLDYSIEKNFHYNMIYFLDGEKYQNDIEIADSIGKLWTSVTEAKGIYLSKNLRKYKGVGLIKHDELDKRKSLESNVLYLVKTEYFIKMKLKSESGHKLHTFDRGQTPK